MGAQIAGIGVGLFILAVIWASALLLCFTLSRANSNISWAGFGAIVAALVITIVLAVLPRGTDVVEEDIIVYDAYIIGRLMLVAVSALFALVGFLVFFGEYFMSQRFAEPLVKKQ